MDKGKILFGKGKEKDKEFSEKQTKDSQHLVPKYKESLVRRVKNKDDLTLNLSKEKVKKYICIFPGCEKAYKKPSLLEIHIRSHTKEKPFCCSYEGCDKAYNRKDHLTRHLLAHQIHEKRQKHNLNSKDKKIPGFPCPVDGCNRTFLYQHYISKHIKFAHESKLYKCTWPDCKESFNKSNRLHIHICKHKGVPPYQCIIDGCKKGFNTPSLLKAHLASHSDKSYYCDNEDCKATFKTHNELRSHKRRVHPFICYICSSIFGKKNNLDLHMKYYHSKDFSDIKGIPRDLKPFKCKEPNCGREFQRKTFLEEHMNTIHLKSKKKIPCSVSECSLMFPSKIRLLIHIRRKHPETLSITPNNHHCPILNCDYVCLSKGRITYHLKTIHKIIGWEEEIQKLNEKIKNDQLKEDEENSDISNTEEGNEGDDSNYVKEISKYNIPNIEEKTDEESKTKYFSTLLGLKVSDDGYQFKRKYKCPLHDCQYRFDRLPALEFHITKVHGLSLEYSDSEDSNEELNNKKRKRNNKKLDEINDKPFTAKELKESEESIRFLNFRDSNNEGRGNSALEHTLLLASKKDDSDYEYLLNSSDSELINNNPIKNTVNSNEEEPCTKKLEVIPNNNNFKCSIKGCNKSYINKSSLYRHLKHFHKQ